MSANTHGRKIILVSHSFLPDGVGGTEVYTYQLAKALTARGNQVTIVAAMDASVKTRYSVIQTQFDGLSVLRIVNSPSYAKSFKDYFVDPNIDARFKQILTERAPDIVHFQHTANLSGTLPEIAHEMCVPAVFTPHDYWYLCFRSHLVRPGCGICPGPSEGMYCASCEDPLLPNPTGIPRSSILVRSILRGRRYVPTSLIRNLPSSLATGTFRALYKRPGAAADRVVDNKFRFSFFKRQLSFPEIVLSPSWHLKMRYENEGFTRIKVLPLGFGRVDVPQGRSNTEKLRLAFIGMIERDKGVAVLLHQMLQFRPLEKLEIHIHGRSKDALYLSEVEKLVAQYPAGRVILHGPYRSGQELTDILSRVDAIVFPSLWEENYPLVVREALLRGVPVIASKYGGVVEAIEDKVNGLLFDPYEDGDLLQKVKFIDGNDGVLDQLARGALRTKIESMDDHVSKLISLYAEASSRALPV